MNNHLKVSQQEADQINLRSDDVREIMGHIPNRIIRYGISVIAVVLTGLFVFSFFFRYPDVINGSFYIQTANPPAFMLARSSGKIQSLLVNEGDSVFKDQLLSVIENATNLNAYQQLKMAIQSRYTGQISGNNWRDLEALGELQSPYAYYKRALEEVDDYAAIDYYGQKIRTLEQKKEDLKTHILLLQKQVNASKANYAIAKKVFRRDSILFQDQTIAAVQYEKAQKELVSQKMASTNAEIGLSNTQMNLTDLQNQIVEMQLTARQKEQALNAALNQTLDQLKGAMDEWEKRYCFISPIDGQVAFSGIWEENQNVRSGQHVMTVLPFEKSQLVSKVMIPISRSGKVKVDQSVNLKFIDFPYREYGMIAARLDAISAVPDSAYVGTIYLSDSLVTNYGKVLPFKQNMQGIAEIITEDLTLAERLIFPLKAIFKEHVE